MSIVIDITTMLAPPKEAPKSCAETNPEFAFESSEELLFNVVELPVYSSSGIVEGYKLLRNHDDHTDICVVTSTYKVVKNADLFDSIENKLKEYLPIAQLRGVEIKDSMSYNGKFCKREYIFPNIMYQLDNKSTIAFRIIIINGYGETAIKFYAGAIDFFCTNGIVRGELLAGSKKHTTNFNVRYFESILVNAIQSFYTNAEQYKLYRNATVIHQEVLAFLVHELELNNTKANKLFNRFLDEAEERGNNLWALFSTMTYYSSHNSVIFPIRATKSDNVASVLMDRQMEVVGWEKQMNKYFKGILNV